MNSQRGIKGGFHFASALDQIKLEIVHVSVYWANW